MYEDWLCIYVDSFLWLEILFYTFLKSIAYVLPPPKFAKHLKPDPLAVVSTRSGSQCRSVWLYCHFVHSCWILLNPIGYTKRWQTKQHLHLWAGKYCPRCEHTLSVMYLLACHWVTGTHNMYWECWGLSIISMRMVLVTKSLYNHVYSYEFFTC